MHQQIQLGDQAFVSDGGEEFGAVRQIFPESVVVYVENAGDFLIPLEAVESVLHAEPRVLVRDNALHDAVESVHSKKVIFTCGKLGAPLRQAIGHAHDAEERPAGPQ